MNDRFSAQLRQHLLDTADERPAEGQLAAVVEGVAVTRQRHPLVARLTWTHGRIGLFPSTGLRYGLATLALVAVTVGAAVMGGGAGPSGRTVFEGTWTSTDPVDGSTLSLIVGSGSAPNIRFEDDNATGPGCRNDAVKHFTADGTGTISDSRLETRFPDGGGCGLMLVPVPAGQFDHDAATDTLRDGAGATWARVPGDARPGTQAPATVPSTPSPEGTPVCPPSEGVDLYEDGGTYRATVGTISVTATVPAGWHGLRSQFSLLKAPCIFLGLTKLEAELLTSVYSDACKWRDSEVEATTPAAVIEAFSGQEHVTTGPTDVTINGYAASRFEFSFPAALDTTECDDGTLYLAPGDPEGLGLSNINRGTDLTVYVLDVDGSRVAVTAGLWHEDATPANLAELDEVVASMRFGP